MSLFFLKPSSRSSLLGRCTKFLAAIGCHSVPSSVKSGGISVFAHLPCKIFSIVEADKNFIRALVSIGSTKWQLVGVYASHKVVILRQLWCDRASHVDPLSLLVLGGFQ